jgi:hypothetical protein
MRTWGECLAIYRLLVPPPVTIQWRGFTQTLRVRRNPHPPFGVIEVMIGQRSAWTDHFKCGLHAEHVLANGWEVMTPGPFATVMDRLVRDGLAEVVAGPHKPLTNLRMTPQQRNLWPCLDARYTYRGPDGNVGTWI